MNATLFLLLVFATARVEAATRFTAVPDSTQITQDDSVSVKFRVESDSMGSIGELQYSAPDFELLNEYNSTFVSSVYENGRIGIRNTREMTKVLRPKRTGDLQITGISIQVNGQVLMAADFTIKVQAGGVATPPPQRYGGGGSGGLRGAGKRARAEPFFIRAEIDKQKLVKGEQLIVSYYIYRSTRVFNIAVEKYPTLSGFLREDLEMPVLGQRLDSEPVVLDGVPYYRSLLVRYAAYPLQEGKLPIDPMAVKGAYYLQQGGGGAFDDEDDLFRGFFQRMAPQERSMRSEILHAEVEPLPAQGRPASFTGGVGEFEVSSAVDKIELRAHEAVTLTVKIEGKGNTSSIEDPKHAWPPGLELYESKGQARSGRGGVGEKIFEYLLIPRVPGQLRIPALEYSFFDTKKRTYVTKQTQPVEIRVLPGDPSAAPQAPAVASGTFAPQVPAVVEPMGLLGPGDYKGSSVGPTVRGALKGLSWLGWLGVFLVGASALWAAVRRWRPALKLGRRKKSGSLEKLKAEAKRLAAAGSGQEVRAFCDRLEEEVFSLIDRAFAVGARALPREELRRLLTEEYAVDSATWAKIEEILEFTEVARFSSRGEPDSQVRAQLSRHVGDLRMVSGRLEQVAQRRSPVGG